MWDRALEVFLKRFITRGRLAVTLPSGKVIEAGDPAAPPYAIRITDPKVVRRLCFDPDMGLGEGYMDGKILIQNDDLRGLFSVISQNFYRDTQLPLWQRPIGWARSILRNLMMINPAARSKSNVAHHYDLSGELYELFLDTDRQYSCAYWSHEGMTLEQAQEAKKQHIARKLLLQPGMRVLDIGCGWGGMALTLARDYGVRVVGVTLSEEQLKIARSRAQAEGLAGQVEFHLMDYRKIEGPFDRIVSVGMFEHVGVPQYQTFFNKVRDLLTEDGVALIHTIGQNGVPQASSSWILKYIFPGGYTPALSDTAPRIEKAGLWVEDIEFLRLHYAKTLAAWHDRFMANIYRLPPAMDDRFRRMWRFYLLSMEMSFTQGRLMVQQYQLSKQMLSVPMTRDYLYRQDGAEALAHAAE